MSSRFLVLLDRDGTLIEDRDYLDDPAGVALLPGAAEGLKALQAGGAVLAVVSNQSGIGRGYYTKATADRVNARLQEILREHGVALVGIFICPHAPDAHCKCRKPATGLLEQASAATGLPLPEAYMIGDKASDIEAGQAAGCTTVLVRTGYGEASRSCCTPDAVVDDLAAAARWILDHRRKQVRIAH